ncbi:glycine cleavage system H family protein [Enterococcus sp. LJL98]
MKTSCLKRKENLWILFNGSEYVVGLTSEAQEELGEITFADLPEVGQEMVQGEMLLEVEAEKAVSEFSSPLTGVISSVNEQIDQDIHILNAEDEMNAWLVSYKNVSEAEFNAL